MDSQLIYVRNYEGLPGAWFKAVPNKPGCYERIVYRREGRCKRKSKECRDKMRTAAEHSRKQGQRVKLVVCPCCVPEVDSEPSLPSDFPITEERPTLKPFFTDSDSEESQKDPGVFETMKGKVVGMFKHLFGCLVPGACCLDEEELVA